ncbi:hypothetical protein ACFU4Z_12155, partial [Nocardia sp. NPDC057440]
MRPGTPNPGAPDAKAKSFKPSLKRLLARLAPERVYVVVIVLLVITAVVLNTLGPYIMGKATNLVFDGVVGKQLPEGISKDQAIESLRSKGDNTFADMLGAMDVIPGVGGGGGGRGGGGGGGGVGFKCAGGVGRCVWG